MNKNNLPDCVTCGSYVEDWGCPDCIKRPGWEKITSAPRDGSRITLWIPYTSNTEATCLDHGHWDADVEMSLGRRTKMKGCWRFDGDDGAFDIQPTHWRRDNAS